MSVHATLGDRQTALKSEMAIEPLDRAIRNIELGLARDDPAFVRRLRRQASAERTNATVTIVLLVATLLLLAIGLATYSSIAYVAGGLTFLSAFTVDRYRRTARRPFER